MATYGVPFNTYGLNIEFLASLGISGPLINRIFVTNLHYRADVNKVKQIFKLAGEIVNVDCGAAVIGRAYYCIIEYEHPVEAVQAISLFDHQLLYNRRMSVRLDRKLNRYPAGIKLPVGIINIGMGLGPYGLPLRNVTQNLMIRNHYWKNYYYDYTNAAGYNNMAADMNRKMNLNRTAAHPMPSPLMQPPAPAPAPAPAPIYVNNKMDFSHRNSTTKMLNVNDLTNSSISTNTPLLGGTSTYNGALNFNSNARNIYNAVYKLSDENEQCSPPTHTQNFQSTTVTRNAAGCTVVIKNLPPNYNWQMLHGKFSEIGEIKHAEIRPHGNGIVRFVKKSDADLAIKMLDGADFNGHIVKVLYPVL